MRLRIISNGKYFRVQKKGWFFWKDLSNARFDSLKKAITACKRAHLAHRYKKAEWFVVIANG